MEVSKSSKPKPKRNNTGILIKKSTMIIQNFRDMEEEYDIGDKLGSGSYGIGNPFQTIQL